jgi:hypothetical protein
MSDNVTVTVTFLLSQEHSQRDQIYVFKILFCLTVQSHLHQIQYVHMAHGFPPPFCTGKMFLNELRGARKNDSGHVTIEKKSFFQTRARL